MDASAIQATGKGAPKAAGRKNRSPKDAKYVRQRVSVHNGTAYWWGDFRRFKDVGGKHESLSTYLEPGETIQSDEEARTVYWRAVGLYMKRQKALAANETVDVSTTAAGAPKVVRAAGAGATAKSASSSKAEAMPAAVNAPTSGSPGNVALAAELARLLNIPLPAGADLRLAAAAQAHLERKRENAKIGRGQDSTCDTDASSFKALVRHLGADTLLTDIKVDTLEKYIKDRLSEPGWKKDTLISTATVRNELHALSNLYSQLTRRDEFTFGNPVSKVMKPAAPSDEAEYLQLSEFARLLDAATEEDEESSRARRAMELVHSARAEGARGHARSAAAQLKLDQAEALYPTECRKFDWERRYPTTEALFAVLGYSGPRFEEGRGVLAEEADWGRSEMI